MRHRSVSWQLFAEPQPSGYAYIMFRMPRSVLSRSGLKPVLSYSHRKTDHR